MKPPVDPKPESPCFIRPIMPGEEVAACELVLRVFEEFVAPGYSPEGREEFQQYAHPDALAARLQAGNVALVATFDDAIVGIIEVRDNDHLSLLFVDSRFQRQGIASRLLRHALTLCRQIDPGLAEVTVNSSPYALPIYRRMGFVQVEDTRIIHGIVHVPMRFLLT